jgi:hypothetical protein
MAKQAAGTHQPLGYRNRVRLNAAIRHLKSPFHAVRVAAHKEIQAILNRKRGVRRLRAWLADRARAGARKVTPKQLHGPLRVRAQAPQARKQGSGRAMPIAEAQAAGRIKPPAHGYGQTMADVKERARAAQGKTPRQTPAPRTAPGAPRPARMQAQSKPRWAGLRRRVAGAPASARTAPAAPEPPRQVFDRLPSGYAPTPPSPARNRTA